MRNKTFLGSIKVKKSTTILTLAGVLALAGCTNPKVMDDRYYETPKDENGKPVQVNTVQTPRPVENETVSLSSKKSSAYTPMNIQENDGAGLDDNAALKMKGGKKYGKPAAAGTYVVKSGDTLVKIAKRHNVALSDLMKANNLTDKDARKLKVGKKLVIPGGKAVPAKSVNVKSGKKSVSAPKAADLKGAGLNADGTYTIRRGDNIPKIARKFGVRAKAIQDANGLSDEATRKLQIGQKLVIPVGGKAAPVAKSVKTAPKPVEPVQTVLPPPAEEKSQASAPAPAADSNTSASAPAADSGVNSADTATDFLPVGDAKTLSEFAAKHGTTVEKLRQLNTSHANSDKLDPNEYLFVPRK